MIGNERLFQDVAMLLDKMGEDAEAKVQTNAK
ncbi:hypothetical protein Poly51_63070 [Rubripirellula tenax]|uniref:Uncharacterized protein n=1 Tax=Rubripirellula tenax TaxID=2528015 RepID=A0A5C6E4I4_9BACT|nr:hypothetical protein Poly51_63070 [Rubripirellula tenax]